MGAELILAIDLTATVVFGLSGGLLAIRKRFDVFGVVTLTAVAAVGGGIVRDLLIGDVPPVALREVEYWIAIAVAAVLVVVVRFTRVVRIATLVADAVGLGLFAVVGTEKALQVDVTLPAVVAIGVVTAVGGGTIRDVLANEVPTVLTREIYATAALLGSVVVVAADLLAAPEAVALVLGTGATGVLRLLAVRRRWEPPRPRGRGPV